MPVHTYASIVCASIVAVTLAVGVSFTPSLSASTPQPPAFANLGPYNVTVLEGSVGTERSLPADVGLTAPGAPWSMTGWILSTRRQEGTVVVAGVGDTDSAAWRGLVLIGGELGLQLAPATTLRSGAALEPGRWHHIAASYDGTTARLYVDGRKAGVLQAPTAQVQPRIAIAPTPRDPIPGAPHFGGSLAGITLEPYAIGAGAMR